MTRAQICSESLLVLLAFSSLAPFPAFPFPHFSFTDEGNCCEMLRVLVFLLKVVVMKIVESFPS